MNMYVISLERSLDEATWIDCQNTQNIFLFKSWISRSVLRYKILESLKMKRLSCFSTIHLISWSALWCHHSRAKTWIQRNYMQLSQTTALSFFSSFVSLFIWSDCLHIATLCFTSTSYSLWLFNDINFLSLELKRTSHLSWFIQWWTYSVSFFKRLMWLK